MNLKKIIVATGNAHKLREIRQIFPESEVLSAAEAGYTEEAEETGTTFEENAVIKASAAAKALRLPVMADDSGICAEALCGAPGIYSARYAGGHGDDRANRAKLLKDMKGKENRAAKFTCAVALCIPDGEHVKSVVVTGETHGKILEEDCGDGGFGYDPIFFSDDLQKSFGVATAEEKNAVSHRKRALTALKEKVLLL